MDIPGVGVIQREWDLRNSVDSMFNGIQLAGKSVVEIGPSSGFLTFAMEDRGADVLSVEAPFCHSWDIVPFPHVIETWEHGTRMGWEPITNAWWFAREQYKSRANIVYISAYEATRARLGEFDISILSNMLMHNSDPARIVANCAQMTKEAVVIIEPWNDDLEALSLPVIRFDPLPNPEPGKENWNLWWRFSTRFFANLLTILGFPNIEITRYAISWNGTPIQTFTLTARKMEGS